MNIFRTTNYRTFLKEKILNMPKAGRGINAKLATYLGVQSVVISQVLSGQKDFTEEHSLKVAQFFSFTPLETDTFLLLVKIERAGTEELRSYYKTKLHEKQKQGLEVNSKFDKHYVLSDEDKAIFYSNWYYCAVCLMTTIQDFHTPEKIAQHLGLSKDLMSKILNFLLSRGLLIKEGAILKFGPTSTYIPSDSLFINNHRRNWRLKALEHLSDPKEESLYLSSVVTLSKDDAKKIQDLLQITYKTLSNTVRESTGESLFCLNIDWFQVS